MNQNREWLEFFDKFISGQTVKITCIQSKQITWTSLTGKCNYSSITEKLQFQSTENRFKYEFEIIEVQPEKNIFKSYNGTFSIEIV